jgi:hypothetical protein
MFGKTEKNSKSKRKKHTDEKKEFKDDCFDASSSQAKRSMLK